MRRNLNVRPQGIELARCWQFSIRLTALALGLEWFGLFWVWLGRTNLEKLITDLMMPVGVFFLAILAGLIWASQSGRCMDLGRHGSFRLGR